MNPKLWGLGAGTDDTVTRNWRQVLGPFPPLLMDINSMKYKQETVKYYDKVITGKYQGKVVWTTSVWEIGPRHGVKMDIKLRKMIILLMG